VPQRRVTRAQNNIGDDAELADAGAAARKPALARQPFGQHAEQSDGAVVSGDTV
jgi:hypothetical protein